MSKNKNNIQEAEIVEKTPIANPQGKTVEELKEIVQTLQTQRNQHQKKVQETQTVMNQQMTMVTKAQGALEVVLQMIPKERVDQMIAEEASQRESLQKNGQKTS